MSYMTCGNCGLFYSKPCEVQYKYLEDGTKVRVSERSGSVVPEPPALNDIKSGYIGAVRILYCIQ